MTDHIYTLEELTENPSFRRWAKGEANTEDKEYWDDWVMAREENRNIARAALAALSGFSLGSASKPDARKAWHRFNQKLEQEYGTISKSTRRDKRAKITDLRWVYRVAAGILIILTTGLMVYFGYPALEDQKQVATRLIEQEISTDFGERKNIRLADGSFITLNANSKLLYSRDPVHTTNIKIHLQGEAFFSVTHREHPGEYPFRVQTADGTVRVLGTEFVVSTRDDKTQVVLEEGSVEVSLDKEVRDEPEQAILKPGQLAEFDSLNDTLVIRKVNTEVYTSWRTRKLIFDRTPLPDVLKRIEHTFGVDVEVRDSGLYNQTISGTIQNAEMSLILSTLSKVISAPIEVQGTTVYVGKS